MVKLQEDKDIFLLIDSNALVHRAYHAFPSTLTISKTGQQVNAVFGFTKLLLEVLEKFKPKYAICAFDSSKPTIRHTEYADYKAHRKPIDTELISQFPIVYEVVEAFNIPLYKIDGFEADDIIGTLTDKIDSGLQKIIVTGDNDLLQLVTEETFSYMAGFAFKNSKLYGIDEVKEKFGFGPERVIDYKAIRGDASDNIPGVKGIGEKGATKLIQEFGSIEEMYQNIDNVDNRNRQKLIDFHEDAMLSKKLATILKDVPLNFKIEDAILNDYDPQKVKDLFMHLEFRSLINKLPDSGRSVETIADSGNQFSLFSDKGSDSQSEEVEIKTTENNSYRILNTMEELDEVLKKIRQNKIFAFDTETDTLDVMKAKVYGISLGLNDSEAVYISKNLIDNSETKEKIRKLFVDEEIIKIAHNAKFDLHVLANWGLRDFEGQIHDTMLMAYLLQEGEGRTGLKELAFNKLGMVMKLYEDLYGGKSKIDINQVNETELGLYSCADSHATWLLFKVFSKEFEDPKNTELFKLYKNVELKIMLILFQMERNGIKLNSEFLSDFSKELEQSIQRLQEEIFHIVGHEFNVNSPKQLGEILFIELGLPGGKKTKTGAYSTNEKILMNLKDTHPIIQKVRDFREIQKLKSTYTDALIDKVYEKTGRIHTSFNQAVTATGRLSSSDPNLQNIPISTELGMKIREAFVSDKNRIFMGLDIAQQELRVVAIISGEDKLIDAFKKDVDVHSLTASQVFGVDVEEVDPNQRRVGKTLNFSILYGISAFGLSDRLKVPREEAQSMIDKFWESYPEIDSYFKNLINTSKEKGYAETIFGRRRNAANLKSTNFRIRAAAERELINFPVQGTSADLMKMSMIKVNEYLKQEKSKLNPNIILQVHDELILEIDEGSEEEIKNLAQELKEVMESTVKFEIPLIVDPKIGKNWANMEKLNLNF